MTTTLIFNSNRIDAIARMIRNCAFDSINSRDELRAFIASFIDSRDYARCDDELICDAINAFIDSRMMNCEFDSIIECDDANAESIMQFMQSFNNQYAIAYSIAMMIAH